MNGAIDRHIDHVRALTRRHGPLDIDAPTASIHNPAWFDANGAATDERAEVHASILEKVLASGDHTVGLHGIVMAGAPGAGKSHLREHELAAEVAGHVLLDVDLVKHDLLVHDDSTGGYASFLKPAIVREYEAKGERFFPLELSALVHREATQIVTLARREALREGLAVVVDGVLSGEREAIALGAQLERAGYGIDVVCMDVSAEVSEHQIRERWREAYQKTLEGGGDLMGGRWVPSSFAQHVLNGPGGRPLPVSSSETLARGVGAVSRYRVFSRESVDAPTVLTTDLARIRAGGPLIERSAAQAHRTALGRPSARPAHNRTRGQGYER